MAIQLGRDRFGSGLILKMNLSHGGQVQVSASYARRDHRNYEDRKKSFIVGKTSSFMLSDEDFV